MSLDLHSVAVFAAVLALLLAIFMRIAGRDYPEAWQAPLAHWFRALVCLSFGMALLSGRDHFEPVAARLMTAAGNAFLYAGFGALAISMRRFCGWPGGDRAVWALVACGAASSLFFVHAFESYQGRTVAGSLTIAGLLWMAARPAFPHFGPGGTTSYRMTGWILLSGVLAMALRAIWEATPSLRSMELMEISSLHQFVLFYVPIAPVLATFGFVLMCADRANAELRRLATVDALTGAWNRQALQLQVRRGLALDRRHRRPSALLLLDVDHFKRINDSLGHAAGDAVLNELVRRIRGHLREEDVVGRLGGEEFIVFLPCTDASGAREVAERLRCAIEREPFACHEQRLGVTVSIGVSERLPGEDELPALLRRADRAMYAAKRAGRNRVMVAASLQAAPAIA